MSMPKIIFKDSAGHEKHVDATSGQSVMEAAVRNSVPGIVAECGGACACATCHVYVDEAFLERLPPLSGNEQGMLEFAEDVKSNSRLACQIKISDDHEGLRITIPVSQG